jgi:hypothetical protein
MMTPPTQPFPNATEPAAFVVDVSVTRTWIARRLGTIYTFDVMSALVRSTAIAPRGFVIELAEEILLLERQGQYSATQTNAELAILMGYPILVDDLTLPLAWGGATIASANRCLLPTNAISYSVRQLQG